ncbi:phage tail protein [Sandarakinorhabdus sp.]|uniref:phage tail protein n=1 Tax=Sandarakinorhabdus sp. TaxID=1916663 RepID=UPI00286DF1D9|nr:phage tail protein [Sandarakinorhabdus sp.]
MPDTGKEQSTSVWPLPKFNFTVTVGDGATMSFQEVSGLDMEAQAIEYRAGDSRAFSAIKMPGIKKFSDVTLKKGMFKADNKLLAWFNQSMTNSIERKPVTISLLDETGREVFTWKLLNAFPIKISGKDLNSTGNDMAVETIVLAHEGLTMEAK